MLIAFVHSGQSFMPEIAAYINYFSSRNISCVVTTPDKVSAIKRDVEWFFLGTDLTKQQKNIVRIHEYPSASTPPFAGLKNRVKSFISVKPDFRIYLNDFVQKALAFSDNVPFGLRDMGIPREWLLPTDEEQKKTDFIYIGNTSPQRKIAALLMAFTKPALSNKTILVISQNYATLQDQFKDYHNIQFTGPLTHEAIRSHLLASRFALNYIPDILPYNAQTSTKFLEYAATKIAIVSTEYYWLTDFKKKYGGNYYYLKPDLSNLEWEQITSFNYAIPDLSGWTWERQIDKSGVLEFLRSKFPGQSF